MSIVVFWIQKLGHHTATMSEAFGDDELSEALKQCEELRRYDCNSHVCISSEMSSSVGKAGVTAVVDGKLPDGSDYTWMKRRSQ